MFFKKVLLILCGCCQAVAPAILARILALSVSLLIASSAIRSSSSSETSILFSIECCSDTGNRTRCCLGGGHVVPREIRTAVLSDFLCPSETLGARSGHLKLKSNCRHFARGLSANIRHIFSELSSEQRSFCVFATHYHELAALEAQIPGVINIHVSALAEESRITLLFKVAPGPCSESFGVRVSLSPRIRQHR